MKFWIVLVGIFAVLYYFIAPTLGVSVGVWMTVGGIGFTARFIICLIVAIIVAIWLT